MRRGAGLERELYRLHANPANPFDGSAARIGPYYDFDKTRINSVGTLSGPSGAVNFSLNQYFPQNGIVINNTPAPSPYLYFKAVAGVYTTTPFTPKNAGSATLPYVSSASTSTYINPSSYQLLCPGMDGNFGNYSSPPQYPAGGNYDQKNGLDDMTNFTNGTTVQDDTP